MRFDWEEFKLGPTQPRAVRLHVTLNRKGMILLNGNIHDKMGNPEAVVLLFDKKRGIIGLDPVSRDVSNSFHLREKTGGRHRIIMAGPFCRFYNIRMEGTRAFAAPQIDEDGILQLDINGTTPAMQRRKRPRDRQN